MSRNLRSFVRVALLLACMLVFQSLRLLLPLPPILSVFGIGSLVNACLLLAVEFGSWQAALFLAGIAPIVAYLQQIIPLPIFIVPVAAANAGYILAYSWLAECSKLMGITAATGAKFAMVAATVTGLTQYLELPEKVVLLLQMLLGWPQLITGLGGGVIFLALRRKLLLSALR